ncbi:uncharacterized protein LOC144658548 isoform X1 [Oculina patagonica]
MHFAGLLVLVFVHCCITQAVSDNPETAGDLLKEQTLSKDANDGPTDAKQVKRVGDEKSPRADEQSNFGAQAKFMVNGLKGDEPLEDVANYASEKPPVNGAGDEGTRSDSSPATEPPPVNGASDEGTRSDNSPATEPPPVNGAGDEGTRSDSRAATEPPPVNGAGDEGTKWASDSIRPEREVERDTLVNVQVNGVGYGTHEAVNLEDFLVDGIGDEVRAKKDEQPRNVEDEEMSMAPGQEYRARDKRNVSPEWFKETNYTSWCGSDREIIKYHVNITECQALCYKKTGCIAVEYWEKYNFACFECKNLQSVKPYTWTNDKAYPVYVWRWRWVWRKFTSYTSWCYPGRILISKDQSKPIDHIECQKRCQAIPGCNAIEFWEKYNYACFQCPDTSVVKHYGWVNDLAYPVYVWVPCRKLIYRG